MGYVPGDEGIAHIKQMLYETWQSKLSLDEQGAQNFWNDYVEVVNLVHQARVCDALKELLCLRSVSGLTALHFASTFGTINILVSAVCECDCREEVLCAYVRNYDSIMDRAALSDRRKQNLIIILHREGCDFYLGKLLAKLTMSALDAGVLAA